MQSALQLTPLEGVAEMQTYLPLSTILEIERNRLKPQAPLALRSTRLLTARGRA